MLLKHFQRLGFTFELFQNFVYTNRCNLKIYLIAFLISNMSNAPEKCWDALIANNNEITLVMQK